MRRLAWSLMLAGLAFVPLQAEAAESLRVQPLRSRPVITAGETRSDKISLRNTGATSLTINLSVERFEVSDEQYNYRFGAGQASDWVRFVDQEFRLDPGQEREAAYSVAIPATAAPGGYYFALFAAGETPQTDAIREVKRVASMIYLEVPGELNRDGAVLGVGLPWLSLDRRLAYELRLINQGNTHYETDTRLQMRTIFGQGIIDKQITGLLLPGSIRSFTGELELPPWPGLYRVDGKTSFPNGTQILPSRYIVYAPIWFIAGLVVIACGVVTVWLVRRRQSV